MIKRISSVAMAVAVFTLVSIGTFAGEIKPYSQAAFKEAEAAWKTVLLDFHVDWCPVCKKQGPILMTLVQEEKLKDIAAFKMDYDNEKALKRQFKVTSQSTLVILKGKTEVSRAPGLTD